MKIQQVRVAYRSIYHGHHFLFGVVVIETKHAHCVGGVFKLKNRKAIVVATQVLNRVNTSNNKSVQLLIVENVFP